MAARIAYIDCFIDGLDDLDVSLGSGYAVIKIGTPGSRITIYPNGGDGTGADRALADLLTIAEIGDRIAELAKAKAAELAQAATVEADA